MAQYRRATNYPNRFLPSRLCFICRCAIIRWNLLLNVFAPFAASEFLRVLSPHGVVLQVIPGARHLWEMKCCLYERPYENEEPVLAPDGFVLEKQIRVRYVFDASENQWDLFFMTPYMWRTSPQDREKLMNTALSSLTADFLLRVLLPKG